MSVGEVDGKVRFSVSDTGMGIKEDDLPRLFQKFNRGTGSPLVHTEGTGLGLYVAKMMVEAQNGRIWGESKGENMGSQFYFELPTGGKQEFGIGK
jgi:signal transduction histidine kinase